MQWQEIIEFLGGTAIFGTVLGYLGKVAIDAYASGRIEAYKSELQRVTTGHSVRFQRLHAERADVIKEFYEKLARLDDALASTLAFLQSVHDTPLAEKVTALGKHFIEIREYFVLRRIFFAEGTCQLVDQILDLARGIFFDITTYTVDPTHPEYKYDRGLLKERHEFWEKARTAHKTEFVNLKHSLETEFRKLLGIERAKPNLAFEADAVRQRTVSCCGRTPRGSTWR